MTIKPTTTLQELRQQMAASPRSQGFDEERLARSIQQSLRVEGFNVSIQDAVNSVKQMNNTLVVR